MGNILKDKNIVKTLLTKLSEFGTIPNDGFLCGGAIANTLMSMEWGGDYPVNDLDIFVESKKDKRSNTPERSDKLIIQGAEYAHLSAAYNHGNNYKIISSERDGMINIIKVFRSDRKVSENFMYLLKGFDFNCVQVGIDLKKGELIYTNHFEEFLKDRQLKVVAPYTPGHTALRLFKKLEELKCYCDIEGQMKLLSQPFNNKNMIKHDGAYTGVFGMYFSIKYKELYDRYKDKISEYFQLATLFEHKKWMWEKKFELENVNRKDIDRDNVMNWLDPSRNPPQEYLDRWSQMNGKIWGLIPTKYDIPDEGFNEVIKDIFSPLALMSVWGILYGNKNNLIKKAKMVFKYQHLTQLAIVNDDFFDCDFDDKGCKILEGSIHRNVTLGKVIHRYNLNLQEGIEINKNISKLLNKEGKWFSELIYRLLMENGNSFVQPNLSVIMGLFEKEKKKLTKPMIMGFDMSGLELPKNVEVKELVSEYDLAYAGRALKNCLDNPGQEYKRRIKSGKTKVFAIITPNSMSALELRKVDSLTWSEVYLLSYCNKMCNQYHRNIGDYIKGYFHKELILNGVSEVLTIHEKAMEKAKKDFNMDGDTSTADNEVDHGGMLDDMVEDDGWGDEPALGEIPQPEPMISFSTSTPPYDIDLQQISDDIEIEEGIDQLIQDSNVEDREEDINRTISNDMEELERMRRELEEMRQRDNERDRRDRLPRWDGDLGNLPF